MKMNALIIEDETPAAKRLESILVEFGIKVLAKKECVTSAIDWLEKNKENLDIIFSDIQLEDGTSFEIFEVVNTNIPIVFTTAYSEFALKAFQVNSIDYLLKPFSKEAVKQALEKQNNRKVNDTSEKIRALINELQPTKNYKTRFLTSMGKHISVVFVKDIELFFSEEKILYAFLKNGHRVFLDGTIEKIVKKIDPEKFFQINRKCVISCDAIHQMKSYRNSRIKIHIKHFDCFDLIVARERVKDFKNWLEEK